MDKISLLCIILSILVCQSLYAATYYVDITGNDVNDGTPDSPFATIQKGIDTAQDGDTVIVNNGAYTGEGNVNIDFKGKAITVKSINGAVVTIIDGKNTPNTRGVIFQHGETNSSVLDGFTITHGMHYGAGIFCNSSSPTIQNCIITNNNATWGAGIYCDNTSSPSITNCIIIGNTASVGGGGIYCDNTSSPSIINCIITGNTAAANGGGIRCSESSPNITNCTITGNTSNGAGGGIFCEENSSPIITDCKITSNTANAQGGGIICTSDSSPKVSSCAITDNKSNGSGGGIYCSSPSSPNFIDCTIARNTSNTAQGGGILCDASLTTITNCNIIENTSYGSGGGIYCSGSTLIITNCTIAGNNSMIAQGGGIILSASLLTITNSTITENSSYGSGGGIYCSGSSPSITNCVIAGNTSSSGAGGGGIHCSNNSSPTIINCTMTENTSGSSGGGIWCGDSSSPTVKNTILWGNMAVQFGNQVRLYGDTASITITYSDVQDGQDGIAIFGGGTVIYENNIDAAPLFVDSANGTYHLRDGSPCIGKGTAIDAPALDIEGLQRGTPPDIGAYENPLNTPAPLGDLSGDGTVSAYDSALILQFVVGIIDTFPVEHLLHNSPEDIIPCHYEISIPNVSVAQGQQFDIPIQINEATGLMAAGITLKYDATVLRAVDFTASRLLSGSYWEGNIERQGEVRFAFASVKPIKEQGNLLNIKFSALPNSEGRTTSLILDQVQLSKSLYIKKINGLVTILPNEFRLLQNYPNPFNPETWIPYKLSVDASIVITIYNIKGQPVRRLFLGHRDAGVYTTKDKAIYWDGRNESGESVASGIYYYTIQVRQAIPSLRSRAGPSIGAGDFAATRKMLLMK